MPRIKQIWEFISTLGVASDIPSQLVRKVIVTNQLLALAGLSTLFFISLYIPAGEIAYAFLSAIPLGVSAIGLYLNYQKRYFAARYVSLILFNASTFLFASIGGEASNFHILFLPLISSCVVLFQLEEKWKMISGILVSILMYLLLEWMDYSLFASLRPSKELIGIIHPMMYIVSVALFVFTLLFLVSVNRKTEEALLKNQRILDEVVFGSSGVFFQYELKPDGNKTLNFISEKIVDLMEITPSELRKNIGAIYDIVLPEYKSIVKKGFLKSYKNFTDSDVEFKIRTKSGQNKWMEVKASIKEKNDTYKGTLWNGTFYDITEKKISEAIIRVTTNELEDFKIALDEHCLVSVTDTKGVILYANQKFCDISGFTNGELVGKTHKIVNSGYHSKEFWAKLWETLLEQKIWKGKVKNKAKNGNYYWVNATIFPLLDTNGHSYRYVSIRNDITEHKEIEENQRKLNEELNTINDRLIIALEKAEEANKAKNLFISSVSHELRTPLNSIIGFSELLKHEVAIPQTKRKYAELTNQSAKHLLQLINEILEYSSSELKKLKIIRDRIDLKTILMELTEMFYLQAKNKNLDFVFCFAESIPELLLGDSKRLNQVLINLLGNAVKFTNTGKIEFFVQDKNFDVKNRKEILLRFIVKDTGTGISSDGLTKIFEPFHRETYMQVEGTGLGLPISQKIAMALGSTLKVESEIGKGTSFWFDLTLPIIADKDAGISQPYTGIATPTKYSGRTALVVDDVEINRMLLDEVLAGAGMKVYEAKDGLEALEFLKEQIPDIILMDVVMPKLDGIETIKKIRENEKLSRLPVIAVTASGFEGKRDELISKGFSEYLLKPVRFEELFQKLDALLQKSK